MSRRGHNAIKGRQGFQPIRSSNPPQSLSLPNLPTTAAEGTSLAPHPAVPASLEDSPRMRDAETRPASVHIANYTWGHALLHTTGPAGPDEQVERYGSRAVVAAYGAKLDKAIDTNRTAEPNAEFHKTIAGDLNGAARTIVRDNSGRYPANVVEAANRIHYGHVADGKLNPHAIELVDSDAAVGDQHFVFSKDAIAVLQTASQEARNPNENLQRIIDEHESRAAEHRDYFTNPTGKTRPQGANLSVFPEPSQALVAERKKLIRTQAELQQAAEELKNNKNPFARKKKTATFSDVQNQISRINDRVRYLENQG